MRVRVPLRLLLITLKTLQENERISTIRDQLVRCPHWPDSQLFKLKFVSCSYLLCVSSETILALAYPCVRNDRSIQTDP